MPRRQSLNIVAWDKSTGVISYAWTLWWHGVSFYITPRWAPLSGVKMSLHGPSAEHPRAGYRADIDRTAMVRARRHGGTAGVPTGGIWFEGRPTPEEEVRHIVTLRWTPGLFRKGVPSGPNPNDLRPAAIGHVVPAPAESYASDVDFYVCANRPWWPTERQARADNACIGPLGDGSGGFLAAVSVRRRLNDKQTPVRARLTSPLSRRDKVRAIGAAADDESCFSWSNGRRENDFSRPQL